MYSFEATKNRRLAQCACAIFWCLLSGGPVFGFAALKPILIKEHIYENVCDISINSTTSSNLSAFTLDPNMFGTLTNQFLSNYVSASENDGDSAAKCIGQDLKLNMMFTVAAALTNVSALLIGRVLDIYGPKVCGLIGALFLYLACFTFIYAKQIDHLIDPYVIGYALMALGGPFAYISSFQLSNSFPKKSGSILALITGAFDASSAVFLVYRIVYNKSMGAFTLDKLFKCYLFVPLFITIAQFAVMPSDSYKTSPETKFCVEQHVPEGANEGDVLVIENEGPSSSSANETDALLGNHANETSYTRRRDSIGDALKQPYAEEGEANLVKYSGGIFGILHGYSARYQLETPWFYLMCMFATIQMLRLNYFVATIGSQYSYLFHSVAKSEQLTKLFDILLPLGGIISIPFVGLLLDNFSTVFVLSTLLGVSVIIGVLGLFGSFALGVINICFFVAYRPLFYTAVSDYCAKVFGFDTFGTVYGAMICISGVFNFTQSILDKSTHTKFNMNPTPINATLLLITILIGSGTLIYVKRQGKIYKEKKQSQLNDNGSTPSSV